MTDPSPDVDSRFEEARVSIFYAPQDPEFDLAVEITEVGEDVYRIVGRF